MSGEELKSVCEQYKKDEISKQYIVEFWNSHNTPDFISSLLSEKESERLITNFYMVCSYLNMSTGLTYTEGVAEVKINQSKSVYIDEQGIVAFSFESELSDGFNCVTKHGKKGIANKKGRLIVPCEYDDVSNFSDGLALVRKDNKWGFVDNNGENVIPCKYEFAESFSENLACVTIDGKNGFIDVNGEIAIHCEYDIVTKFQDGFAYVKKDKKWGYINRKGDFFKYAYLKWLLFKKPSNID